MKDILIFIPDTLEKSNIGFLEGFSKFSKNNLTFYITNDKLVNVSPKSMGYCSEYTPVKSSFDGQHDAEWIHLNNKTGTITVHGIKNEYDVRNKIHNISYDYNAFKNLDLTCFKHQNYGEHFELLAKKIQDHRVFKLESAGQTYLEIIMQTLLQLILNLPLMATDIFLKVIFDVNVML